MSNNNTYKQTAIDLIPSDWEVKKLGEVSKIIMGQSPDSKNYFDYEIGLPLLQGNADIKERKSIKRIWTNQITKVCEENDIVMSVRAPVGTIAKATFKSCIGRGICSIQSNGLIVKQFLYSYLEKHETDWAKLSQGSTFESINSDDIKQLKIPIPPLPEQQKIAEILGAFDQAISTTKQIVEELKVRNKGLAQQLLTGKMRVKGFEGSKWETLKLEKLGNVISGLTYSPDDINEEEGVLVLRSSNIQDKKIDLRSTVYVKTAQFNPVLKDDILICVRNGSRDLIGKNLLIPKELEGVAFGAFMSVFRSKYNSYLIHLFDSEFYYREIQKNLGATINSINGSDLKKFKFPIPTFEEQKAITNILDKATVELNQYQQKLETLQLQKKGLMQQLLTGKVRVRI